MAGISIGHPSNHACAQSLADATIERDREDPYRQNQLSGVLDRSHPEFDRRGIRTGNLILSPSISMTSAFVSNLLAEPDGSADWVSSLSPNIHARIETDDSNQNLEIFGQMIQSSHARRSRENNFQYRIGGQFKRKIRAGAVFDLRLTSERLTEYRTEIFAPRAADKPIQYLQNRAHLSLSVTEGPLAGRATIGFRNLTYGDPVSRFDRQVLLPQSLRSRDEYSSSLAVEYAISPNTAFLGQLSVNRKDYDSLRFGRFDRDTNGFSLEGGLRFQPSPLLEVISIVGFLQQNFRQPLNDVSGFSGALRIKWLPTELTTVSGRLDRKLQPSGLVDERENFVTRTEVRVDHELRRNILLNLVYGFERYDFNALGRLDSRQTISAGAEYTANPNLVITGSWQHLNQTSTDRSNGRFFKQMTATIGVQLRI